MFDIFRRKEKEPSNLDVAIDELISEMRTRQEDSDEYQKMVSCLRTLMEAKAAEPKPDRVSANTMAVVGGHLLGILMILVFEQKRVIGTKALSLVPKPRI